MKCQDEIFNFQSACLPVWQRVIYSKLIWICVITSNTMINCYEKQFKTLNHTTLNFTQMRELNFPRCYGPYRSVVSTITLRKMTSSFTYVESFNTDWLTKSGQPEAMFISVVGRWKLLDFGSGLKLSDRWRRPVSWSNNIRVTWCLYERKNDGESLHSQIFPLPNGMSNIHPWVQLSYYLCIVSFNPFWFWEQ